MRQRRRLVLVLPRRRPRDVLGVVRRGALGREAQPLAAPVGGAAMFSALAPCVKGLVSSAEEIISSVPVGLLLHLIISTAPKRYTSPAKVIVSIE